jgi:hypothetical protein
MPQQYDRQVNFELYSAENPATPHSGVDIDVEFNAVKIAMDETQEALAEIQQSDGSLARGIVGQAQLAADLQIGIGAPALWETATVYTADVSVVFHELVLYICAVDHTSGVFATDLAADKWEILADFSATHAVADGSITAAKLGSDAVTTVKIQNNAVTTAKIANSQVTTAKIAASNVTTSLINDAAVTAAKLDVDSVTTTKIVDANVTTAKINTAAVTWPKLAANALAQAVGMQNGTLVATVGSSALTVAIKTLAGADPSASDPVVVFFRNVSAGTGDYASVTLTAATSVVISSG